MSETGSDLRERIARALYDLDGPELELHAGGYGVHREKPWEEADQTDYFNQADCALRVIAEEKQGA